MELAKKQWAEGAEEISILLIEDVPGDAAAITKALLYGETLYSFRTHRQHTLAEGISFLMRNKTDVVLLDLGLPDAENLTGLSILHAEFPELPIVIISGRSDVYMVREALRKGAQEFLVKGECSGVTIRQSIHQAIARKKIELSYQRGDKI